MSASKPALLLRQRNSLARWWKLGVAAVWVVLGTGLGFFLWRLHELGRLVREAAQGAADRELRLLLVSSVAGFLLVAALTGLGVRWLARHLALVERLALVDELTGLHNRRFAAEYLQKVLAQGRRSGRAFALLLTDLDTFKEFNDRFGHATGDQVLRQAAQALSAQLRGEALAARWGGEEFLIVLPDADPAAAARVAERLQEAVRRVRAANLTVTVSIGVALYPACGSTGEELLEAADAALYRAKSAGRNRVELALGQPSFA